MSETFEERVTSIPMGLVVAGVGLFALLFVAADQAYFRFADSMFPGVGTSAALASLWGIVSRLHILIPLVAVSFWRPGLLGLRVGSAARHWRMLSLMLLANVSVVAAFILLTGSTPFSGDQWLLTETVTVPVIEELLWRGLVLGLVLQLLKHRRGGTRIAVWSTGIAFGVLHLANALTGVPLAFAAIQATSAVAWGVMYGYARTSTDSVYPAIGLHAAMNAVVVLLS
jgi:membrane protease YdiL (CAAX protease family)